ncbi:MAG TPA: DUF4395 domain-containing protein [Mucilaginibacter sp.]|jgi:hypothetical protein|nr:DUF4395 domain-containing protein [Mucilaginibacter sp.]
MIGSKITSANKYSALVCPVDFVKIDENRVRGVAFFVVLLALAYIVSGSAIVIVLLLADFALRAFNFNTYSPLALVSGFGVRQAGLTPNPVDRAPKRFAAFMGIVFLSAILVLSLAGFVLSAKIIAAVLVLFASLESFLGFCAGCYVYTFLGRIKNRN